jgi:pyridoxal 5'-phosphate synthase pdxS subunit
MIRTKGEAGTGDVVEAVRHVRTIAQEIAGLQAMGDAELKAKAAELRVSEELVLEVKKLGRLPVMNFAAGGVATPADAALMMQLGCDGVFVGSGIFKSENPAARARAIVQATRHFNDPKVLAEVSRGLGGAMPGLSVASLEPAERMAGRGQ